MPTRFRRCLPWFLRSLALAVAFAAGTFAPAASAQKFPAGQHYICPNNAARGSTAISMPSPSVHDVPPYQKHRGDRVRLPEGAGSVNGAKSEILRRQAERSTSRVPTSGVERGHAVEGSQQRPAHAAAAVAGSAAGLTWKPGESDDEYKARVARPMCVRRMERRHPHGGGSRAEGARCRAEIAAVAPTKAKAKAAATERSKACADRNRPTCRRTSGGRQAGRRKIRRPATPRTAPAVPDDAALAAIFGEGGHVARELPGFHFRPQQLAMAQAVARTIAARGQLGGRSRHRHRQDVRLSRSGAAVRRQGHRFHRHQDAAGSTVRARPAHGARRVARA